MWDPEEMTDAQVGTYHPENPFYGPHAYGVTGDMTDEQLEKKAQLLWEEMDYWKHRAPKGQRSRRKLPTLDEVRKFMHILRDKHRAWKPLDFCALTGKPITAPKEVK